MSTSTSAAIPRPTLPERPRPVSAPLALNLLLGGGTLPVLLFAAAWFSVFGAVCHTVDVSFAGDLVATAIVDAVNVGAVDSDNDREVTRWDVSAHGVRGGVPFVVVSFFDDDDVPAAGAVVDVFDNGSGHLVLAKGRRRHSDATPLLVLLPGMLLLGGVVVGSARRGAVDVGLLRDGEQGRARLKSRSVEKDSDGPDNHTLTFVYVDNGVERTFDHKTTTPGPVTDDEDEPILYRDALAALVDALPGDPQIKDGKFVSGRPVKAAAVAVVVVACVVVVVGATVVGVVGLVP